MACPKCGSDKSKSNHFGKTAGTGHAVRGLSAGGHPILAAGVLALKAMSIVNNLVRHKYTCEACNHQYS